MGDEKLREKRERDGLCPNCGTRLFKNEGKGVMSKMFHRTNSTENKSPKRTPLTIPGVVERGQCLKCSNQGGHGSNIDSVFVAIGEEVQPVQALPVTTDQSAAELVPASPARMQGEGERSSDSEYESGSSSEEDSESEYESDEDEEVLLGLKSPPEELSRKPPPSNPQPYNENGTTLTIPPVAAAAKRMSTNSDVDSISIDDDFNVSEFGMCRLDSDPFPSILLDVSGRSSSGNGDEMDERKPPAKPDSEQADIDMSFLEVSGGDRANKKKFECPDGMSPEVFYQLPPEMQEEVMNQKKSTTNPKTDEIDPETLMSLPESIRQEVLDQAQQRRQGPKAKVNGADRPVPRPKPPPSLTRSTSEFLHECDIDAEEFENFPDDVKSDIMRQKERKSSDAASGSQTGETVGQPVSSYDPETLASLPDDVRAEVLNEERRERERLERQSRGNDRQRDKETTSRPGAHCVRNVPAGYDPETFASLPEDVQQELMDDARRQAEGGRYPAGGHDDIVVPAQPMNGMGRSTSCTYTGEYNIAGKRHGDGELLWANGMRIL